MEFEGHNKDLDFFMNSLEDTITSQGEGGEGGEGGEVREGRGGEGGEGRGGEGR